MKEARTINKHIKATLLSMASVLLVPSVNAQEAKEVKEKRYYTPPDYAENVYFGDTHIHSTLSVDASLWGSKMTAADIYRYSRG